MYKEKLKQQLNTDKGPKTHIKDHDYKRIYVEDRPSSEDENEEAVLKKDAPAIEKLVDNEAEVTVVQTKSQKKTKEISKKKAEKD